MYSQFMIYGQKNIKLFTLQCAVALHIGNVHVIDLCESQSHVVCWSSLMQFSKHYYYYYYHHHHYHRHHLVFSVTGTVGLRNEYLMQIRYSFLNPTLSMLLRPYCHFLLLILH